MEINDVIISASIFIIVLITALIFQKGALDKSPENSYFTMAIILKMFGAIFASLIYLYYYGDGDSLYYYRRGIFLRDLLDADFSTNLKVFFSSHFKYDSNVMMYSYMLNSEVISYFTVVQIVTLLSYLGFKSFIGISMLFGVTSFVGNWLMYKTFCKMYPEMYKYFAFGTLFLPSLIFWGSGLFKDTITYSAVGFIFWGFYNIFFLKRRLIISVVTMLISIYLVSVIKAYIVIVLMPFLILWKILTIRDKIQNKFIRVFATPLLFLIVIGISLPLIQKTTSLDARFSLDQLEDRANDMMWWHSYAKDLYGDNGNGSSYTLGNNDLSGFGLVKKLPLAFNVTFFRPYIFEVSGATMLLSAVESMFFLYLFLKVIFKLFSSKNKYGQRAISAIFSNPDLIFMFGFSIVFGIGVGMTSYNFGALSRYKIPALPFFLNGLYLALYLLDKHKKSTELRK